MIAAHENFALDVLSAALRRDLATFVERSFAALEPGTAFSPNWHYEHLCWMLTRVLQRLLFRATCPYRLSKCYSVPSDTLTNDTSASSDELLILRVLLGLQGRSPPPFYLFFNTRLLSLSGLKLSECFLVVGVRYLRHCVSKFCLG